MKMRIPVVLCFLVAVFSRVSSQEKSRGIFNGIDDIDVKVRNCWTKLDLEFELRKGLFKLIVTDEEVKKTVKEDAHLLEVVHLVRQIIEESNGIKEDEVFKTKDCDCLLTIINGGADKILQAQLSAKVEDPLQSNLNEYLKSKTFPAWIKLLQLLSKKGKCQ